MIGDENDINVAAVDRYTSHHAGLGVLMAKLGASWWMTLGSSIAWELLENYFKRTHPQLFPYSSEDSFANASFDTLAVMLGYAFTQHALDAGMTDRGQAAMDAAIGTTVGGALGSMAFGASSESEDRTARARLGYRVGGSVGGMAGVFLNDHGAVPAAGAGAGAAAGGPLGAALVAYIAAGV